MLVVVVVRNVVGLLFRFCFIVDSCIGMLCSWSSSLLVVSLISWWWFLGVLSAVAW